MWKRHQLTLDLVDDRQRDLNPLRRRGRQRERAQERPPIGPQQLVGDVDDAVVKQRRLDPLRPARALVDERLAQPCLGAPFAHVRGRDPRLRQPPLHEQRPQPARVGAIGLGVALLSRNALVSAGSARCTTTPMLASTSYTNNQPVHASTATSICSPVNCATHAPTASRSARKRPRKTSPVSLSSASKVI